VRGASGVTAFVPERGAYACGGLVVPLGTDARPPGLRTRVFVGRRVVLCPAGVSGRSCKLAPSANPNQNRG
jgi:hypothetical protein